MKAAHILLVDDDDDLRPEVMRMLTRLGHRVTAAASGEEGLSLLEGSADVDLLFVDVTMPGIGGVEMAERAVQSHPGLKVLFSSGDFLPPEAPSDAQFIIKPYSRKTLAEKVEAMLGD
ncbi:MAG TPA: response regulator [Reyranella sp.]|jgi:CheY-like chemotaxis protein|nr:response regulator [Reyranella sp.]